MCAGILRGPFTSLKYCMLDQHRAIHVLLIMYTRQYSPTGSAIM